jgi:hypothetical protein
MRKVLLAAALLCIAASPALSQSAIPSRNGSAVITTGNTYQLLASRNGGRRSLTIENNNSTGNCLIEISGLIQVGDTTATTYTISGITVTAAQASILLLPGGAYTRYYPYLPTDPIVGTCASTSASIYLDVQ